MRLSEAMRYRRMIEKASASLPDEEILEVPNLAPEWVPGEEYTVGFRVRALVDGQWVLFRCINSHKSQLGWEPGSAHSLWAKVLIPNPDVIPDWEQPESTNPYSKGDKVRHKGKIWVSTVDGNVWEPGIQGWEEVS